MMIIQRKDQSMSFFFFELGFAVGVSVVVWGLEDDTDEAAARETSLGR